MQWLVIILIGALALSVLRAVLPVLLILLLMALLFAVCFRPKEMLLFGALLLFGVVLQEHGLAVLLLGSLLVFVALVRRPVETREDQAEAPALLLADHSSGADKDNS